MTTNATTCPLSLDPEHECADRDGTPIAGTGRDCYRWANIEATRGDV
jgi:hypothetical protein